MAEFADHDSALRRRGLQERQSTGRQIDVPAPVQRTPPGRPGDKEAPTVASGAIRRGNIRANTIVAKHIQARTITADRIRTRTLTAEEIKAGTITANEITARSITADRIVAGSITANEIAAGTITADEISAGSITAIHIQAEAIVAGKIAANAITAGTIAAGVVTADTIVAGAITSDKIDANAIQANHIDAGVITTEHIAAGSVNADRIQAGTITADLALFAAGAVIDADIFALTAAKITTGQISSALITIADTGQLRAVDSLGATRAQMSAAGFQVFGPDGTTVWFSPDNGLEHPDAIAPGTVGTAHIVDNAITADKIVAGAITAGKINVASLAAITANLGSVTAGTITGAVIRTNAGTPRIELDAAQLSGFDSAGNVTFSLTSSGFVTFGDANDSYLHFDPNFGTLSLSGSLRGTGLIQGPAFATSASEVYIDSNEGVRLLAGSLFVQNRSVRWWDGSVTLGAMYYHKDGAITNALILTAEQDIKLFVGSPGGVRFLDGDGNTTWFEKGYVGFDSGKRPTVLGSQGGYAGARGHAAVAGEGCGAGVNFRMVRAFAFDGSSSIPSSITLTAINAFNLSSTTAVHLSAHGFRLDLVAAGAGNFNWAGTFVTD